MLKQYENTQKSNSINLVMPDAKTLKFTKKVARAKAQL